MAYPPAYTFSKPVSYSADPEFDHAVRFAVDKRDNALMPEPGRTGPTSSMSATTRVASNGSKLCNWSARRSSARCPATPASWCARPTSGVPSVLPDRAPGAIGSDRPPRPDEKR